MKKQIAGLLIPVGILILIFFIIFVINQTANIVNLAGNVNPAFGKGVLYALLIIYAVIITTPFIIFFKMPRILQPPEDEYSPEYEIFLKKLRTRLSKNAYVKENSLPLKTREDIEKALKLLNSKADDVTRSTASTVFVTTAISQNGLLDALMVLSAQIRLIWRVAHVYNQRPLLRESVYLYANVAGTAFVTSELEDLDVSDQIEPVMASVFGGGVAGTIPGVNAVTNLITNSIVEGAANAFLTLRVGAITKRYFSSLTKQKKNLLRKSASLEAGSMLGSIVFKSAGMVSEAIWKASKKSAATLSKRFMESPIKSTGAVWNTSKKSAGIIGDASKKSAGVIIDAVKKYKKYRDEIKNKNGTDNSDTEEPESGEKSSGKENE